MGPDTVIIVHGANGETETVGPSRNSGWLAFDDSYIPGENPDEQGEPWLVGRHLGRINVLTIGGSVKEVNVLPPLNRQIESFYDICAAQGCTLCLDIELEHYSFAESRMFWWTGPEPSP